MIIILFGPPGSGKGTQAKNLEKSLQVKQLSTGDLLRTAIKEGTEFGKKAKSFMDKGRLVPDDVIIDLIRDKILDPTSTDSFLFDGFPRTVAQAKSLDAMLDAVGKSVDKVISLEVDELELIKRLTGRITCGDCGFSYHEVDKPTVKPGICDNCGSSKLIKRDDDKESVVRERLQTFRAETKPVETYYERKNMLFKVNAEGSFSTIEKRLLDAIRM